MGWGRPAQKHALQCNDPDPYEESILRRLAAPTPAPDPLAISSILVQRFDKKPKLFNDQNTGSPSRLNMAVRELRRSTGIYVNNVKL